MSAASIAKALKGHRNGDGYLCRCPVSSHGQGKGDRRPSLSIRDGDTALLVHCFAGCEPSAVLDELRRRRLLDDEHHDTLDAPRRRERQGPPPEPEPDAGALAIWQASEPIAGTLGETYLRRHRGIRAELPPSLRFHPEIVYPRTGHSFPAMVAAVQRPDRKVVAVQVTFLRPSDGTKAPVSAPRLTVGRLGTGAIRLAAASAVLGLAEGMETALSAMLLSGAPCWATMGGQRLGKIGLPAIARTIHIFADDDPAGRLAAELAAGNYSRAGYKVALRWPPEGYADWNDYERAVACKQEAA